MREKKTQPELYADESKGASCDKRHAHFRLLIWWVVPYFGGPASPGSLRSEHFATFAVFFSRFNRLTALLPVQPDLTNRQFLFPKNE